MTSRQIENLHVGQHLEHEFGMRETHVARKGHQNIPGNARRGAPFCDVTHRCASFLDTKMPPGRSWRAEPAQLATTRR